MKGLLEKLDKYIIVTDREGEIYYCNKRLLNQLGRELEWIKGKNIRTLLDEVGLDTYWAGKLYTYLSVNQSKKQYVQVDRIEEDWEEYDAYYFLIEEEKLEHKQSIEIDRIRDEFFRNISHEFRTPINIILSSLQLIESKNDREEMNKESLESYTKKIRKNAFRLLKLSNNLIDLTEMGIGTETLNLGNHNIINIIEETTLSTVEYTKNREIELIFDTEEEDVTMACDAEKIQRMVLNLLSNAVKYTPRKGQIKVRVLKKEDSIVVVVSDTGIGIPKEKCKVIFDSGIQLDASIRRKNEGCGMGLAIVKGIVDMCEGKIHVSSVVGKGTVFTVMLPIQILKEGESINHTQNTLRVERCNMEFSDILEC